jgi:hypothetical protein
MTGRIYRAVGQLPLKVAESRSSRATEMLRHGLGVGAHKTPLQEQTGLFINPITPLGILKQ